MSANTTFLLGLLVLAASSGAAFADVLSFSQQVLTPWPNGTVAVQATDTVSNVATALVTLGPCTYRQLHYHATAVETLFVYEGMIVSTMIAPNNSVYEHTLGYKQGVVYPMGWSHLQYNPNCTAAELLASFNFAATTTVNSINSLEVAPPAYLDNAFAAPLPVSNGLWVANADCLAACAAPPAYGGSRR